MLHVFLSMRFNRREPGRSHQNRFSCFELGSVIAAAQTVASFSFISSRMSRDSAFPALDSVLW